MILLKPEKAGEHMAVVSKNEVVKYICDIRAKLLLDKIRNLSIVPRADKKNQNCMIELGLCHNDVADILITFEPENYCETVEDTDRPGNHLWIFGCVYNGHELYIKICLRKQVVCISFHEKEYDIVYALQMTSVTNLGKGDVNGS